MTTHDSQSVLDEIRKLHVRAERETKNWVNLSAQEISGMLFPVFLDSYRGKIDEQGQWTDSLMEMLEERHNTKYRTPGYVNLSQQLKQGLAVIGQDVPDILERLGRETARQFTLLFAEQYPDAKESFGALHESKHPCKSQCSDLRCNDVVLFNKPKKKMAS